jgi:hypothetical protein
MVNVGLYCEYVMAFWWRKFDFAEAALLSAPIALIGSVIFVNEKP